MSIALVGLLLLQFYWIRNVHQLHADRFKTEVDKSVENAIIDIENFEKNIIYSGLSSYNAANKINSKNQFSFGNLLPISQSITIQDSAVYKKGGELDYLVVSGVSVDSASGIKAEHRVVTPNFGEFLNFESNQSNFNERDSSFSFPVSVGNKYERGVMVKSKYLNELMVKMFTTNIFDDITQRLNPYVLDTIVRGKLKLNKVDTIFNFKVVDAEGKTVEFSKEPSNYGVNELESEFKFQLFPSDNVSSVYFIELDFPNTKSYLFKQMTGTLIAALLLVLMVVFAFYFAVQTIFNQKKVSEIKNDFISNMTHELKTPISTISLACEAIEDPDIKNSPESISGFIEMISAENKRLGTLVEKVLQTSLLEKGKLNLQKTDQEIHELVKNSVKSFQIQFKQRGGELEISRLDEVICGVDKLHFSNVLFNLMDNALKYTKSTPYSKIELIKLNNGFSFSITDNGIGIKKEEQKRIFDKLYRVSTGDVHNVKGFGLGLDYVKNIIEKHSGEIQIKSEINKGSTFKIIIKDE